MTIEQQDRTMRELTERMGMAAVRALSRVEYRLAIDILAIELYPAS